MFKHGNAKWEPISEEPEIIDLFDLKNKSEAEQEPYLNKIYLYHRDRIGVLTEIGKNFIIIEDPTLSNHYWRHNLKTDAIMLNGTFKFYNSYGESRILNIKLDEESQKKIPYYLGLMNFRRVVHNSIIDNTNKKYYEMQQDNVLTDVNVSFVSNNENDEDNLEDNLDEKSNYNLHKIILAAKSDYFYTLFTTNVGNDDNQIIIEIPELQDTPKEFFDRIINYIYTDNKITNLEIYKDLFRFVIFSSAIDLRDLNHQCKRIINNLGTTMLGGMGFYDPELKVLYDKLPQ
jgi:hypothetical protein